MIGDNVNKNFNVVFVRFLAKSLELVACAELIVADFEVGGLVVVVPLAVAVKLHSAVVAL